MFYKKRISVLGNMLGILLRVHVNTNNNLVSDW